MIKSLIKKILPFTIIIGVIAIIGIRIINSDSIYIVRNASINYGNYTWNYYYLDLNLYLKNLESALTNQQLLQSMPLPPDPPKFNFSDVITGLKTIMNILIMVINWIIYVLNCLVLVPIKLLLYPLRFLMILLGFNTLDYEYIQMVEFIYNIEIPPIKYI